MSFQVVTRFMGEDNVPKEITRRRRSVYDAMRRVGQPVLVKHMFNAQDWRDGIAATSPNWDDDYGQVRNDDRLSFNTGYVSTELSPNEWISPTGTIVKAVDSPGTGYVQAPLYRGYGKGYLTYVVIPDAPEDIIKEVSGGQLIKTQQATCMAPWFPEVNDNDLLVLVTLDADNSIVETHERYQAKMSTPATVRGRDRRGGREKPNDKGNRYVVQQRFEIVELPDNHVAYGVEVDR
jgi:hypothetical protein